MNKVVFFRKIFKITFILTLAAFLTWKTVICLQRYNENPTYTTNRYANQDETDFPAMTICPTYPRGYKKSKLRNHDIHEDNYWKTSTCSSNMTWSSNTTVNISAQDLFHIITYQFNELVNKIHIGYFNSIHVIFHLNHTLMLLLNINTWLH